MGLDVFKIKTCPLVSDGKDKILMRAESALQMGLSNQLSKVKKRIWQEIAENMKILHQKYCKKLQEAAEQAKTTEQKREEQSAAGNVLSKVGFHFMMRVDKI